MKESLAWFKRNNNTFICEAKAEVVEVGRGRVEEAGCEPPFPVVEVEEHRHHLGLEAPKPLASTVLFVCLTQCAFGCLVLDPPERLVVAPQTKDEVKRVAAPVAHEALGVLYPANARRLRIPPNIVLKDFLYISWMPPLRLERVEKLWVVVPYAQQRVKGLQAFNASTHINARVEVKAGKTLFVCPPMRGDDPLWDDRIWPVVRVLLWCCCPACKEHVEQLKHPPGVYGDLHDTTPCSRLFRVLGECTFSVPPGQTKQRTPRPDLGGGVQKGISAWLARRSPLGRRGTSGSESMEGGNTG